MVIIPPVQWQYDTCPNRERRRIASGVSARQDQHKYFLLLITIKTGMKPRVCFTYTNLQVHSLYIVEVETSHD